MCHLGTWIIGGFGNAGFMVYDLKGLFQPKKFSDSMHIFPEWEELFSHQVHSANL